VAHSGRRLVRVVLALSTWYREKETHLEMMASMKVKAGVRSTIAEDKVGELYPMPANMKFCTQQL
jgi:hypothetical protein